jgi:hypothetical protein
MDTNNMNQYQQPVYNQQGEEPATVGNWVLTLFLTTIPCVGIILLFVWAFGSGTPKSKSNWAKAQLIWAAIAIVVSLILYLIMGAAMLSAFQ